MILRMFWKDDYVFVSHVVWLEKYNEIKVALSRALLTLLGKVARQLYWQFQFQSFGGG